MELFDRTNAPVGGDKWFVYALVDSREPDKFRYIGITNAPRRRLGHHYSEALDSHTRKARWRAKVLRDGGLVQMKLLEVNLSQLDAKKREVELIALYRDTLTNLTDGGDGAVGWVPTSETREKIAASRRGKPMSDEVREKLRAINTGRASPNKGKTLNPEWRDKISLSLLKRFEDSAEREKISKAVTARFANDKERDRTALSSHKAGPQKNNKSGFKGVSFQIRTKKWVAQIKLEKQTCIGRFPTPEEAARAYDAAAFAAWGADCYLNFPEDFTAKEAA